MCRFFLLLIFWCENSVARERERRQGRRSFTLDLASVSSCWRKVYSLRCDFRVEFLKLSLLLIERWSNNVFIPDLYV